MLLEQRTALVYGGGGAIGSAAARVFAREGARLVLTGRTQAKLDAAADVIRSSGGQAETAVVDVLDEWATNAHADAVAERYGSIDIALNAVSFLHDQGTSLDTLSVAAFMHPIETYLRSLFIISKAVSVHMGEQRRGTILTFAPPAAKMMIPGHLGNITICAGIEAFSRALAADVAPRGIRVVCLRPHAIVDAPAAGSFTGTLFGEKANAAGVGLEEWLAGAAQSTLLKRLPTLNEVAETAAFLASDRAGAMTGTVVNLTCGGVPD